MDFIAFGDESHIHSKSSRCYGIGCFVVPRDRFVELEAQLEAICAQAGVRNELKWNRISDYRPDRAAALEGIRFLLKGGGVFHAMVVEKSTYEKWKGNREEAFYKSYTFMAVNLVNRLGARVELRIDNRSDKYPKRAEVLGIIANNMLTKIEASAAVTGVEMIDSKSCRILQMADVLLGAITADTNQALGSEIDLNAGKSSFIGEAAKLFGWRRLCYDTMPDASFNIWHFPIQFRARPATMREVRTWELQQVAL